MAKVVNYYKKIGDFGKQKYFNPNQSKGALIHPFRVILSSPSGNYKTNTVLNIINTCGNFEKIILCAANGKTEPLYKFLKHKLGKKLIIIDDIDDLPHLNSGVKVEKKKKTSSNKKKHSKEEKVEESDSESPESEEESEKSEEESDSDPEESNLENSIGKKQRLVIFDDMIFEGKRVEKIINSWFARSRHNNYSVALTSQSWFKVPRTVRLNCNYAVFLKMNSLKEIKTVIGDLALGMKPDQLIEAYDFATKEPGHFLLIDNCDSNPEHRIRKDFTDAITIA